MGNVLFVSIQKTRQRLPVLPPKKNIKLIRYWTARQETSFTSVSVASVDSNQWERQVRTYSQEVGNIGELCRKVLTRRRMSMLQRCMNTLRAGDIQPRTWNSLLLKRFQEMSLSLVLEKHIGLTSSTQLWKALTPTELKPINNLLIASIFKKIYNKNLSNDMSLFIFEFSHQLDTHSMTRIFRNIEIYRKTDILLSWA